MIVSVALFIYPSQSNTQFFMGIFIISISKVFGIIKVTSEINHYIAYFLTSQLTIIFAELQIA